MFVLSKLTYIVIFIVLCACKLEGGDGTSFLTSNIGEQLVTKDQFTATEKSIATKICYAFQSKRSNFLSNFHGTAFQFDVVLQNYDCKFGNISKRLNTTLVARSLSEPMFYDSLDSDQEFERYVQTNVHGHLVEICDAIMRGEVLPSPTTEIGDSKRELLEFISSGGLSGFIYKEYQRDWNASGEIYILTASDYMTVLVDPNEDKYGIVLERIRERKCSDALTERKSQLFLP